MFNALIPTALIPATLKLWWIKRQITHLERHERDVAENLKHVRHKLLPALRNKRNALLYPEKYHGTKAVSPSKVVP